MRLVGAQKLLTAHAHQPRAVLRRRTGDGLDVEDTRVVGVDRQPVDVAHPLQLAGAGPGVAG